MEIELRNCQMTIAKREQEVYMAELLMIHHVFG